MPLIRIEGDAPGLPLTFVASGEMANQFEESYSVDIQAKDKAAEGGGQPGQTPHPPNMNFDKGQFENTSWVVKLFSGVEINGSPVPRPGARNHQQLVQIAETLYRLAMPRASGNTFIGPPLVTVQYAAFWRARGLFQKVSFISEGGFDIDDYPSLMTLRMEFARHFGGGAQTGGIYQKATPSDLRRATAQSFAFRG